MCDAMYLGMALVGLLAVGSALRLFVARSPNADLLVSLLADEELLLSKRPESEFDCGEILTSA